MIFPKGLGTHVMIK